MTLTDFIITILKNNHGDYKDLRRRIYSFYSDDKIPNDAVVQNTLSRLKRNGVISHNNNMWEITGEGKELMINEGRGLKNFFPKKSVKTKEGSQTLILFDIPENERYKHDWLRSELIGLGYEMIQRSVWYGPKLPKKFLQYIIEEKIYNFMHIFNVKKE